MHLDGTVGVIGNGAGLTMNTLDLVKQQGGDPADFLDIGGGASAERVRNALEMVLLDPKVRGVFINVFGGITRGDEVARGVIAARDELHVTKPLVVRMTGTMEEEGRRLLQDAGIAPATSATEAAQKIVALTRDASAVSVLVDRHSRVLIQGMTGREGRFHTEQMRAFGTNIVAGVSPGKGGTRRDGVPVFDTVADAAAATGANVAGVFVPPAFAADAIMEAASTVCRSPCASPRGSRCTTWCAPGRCSQRRHEHAARPQLPGHRDAGAVQGRHHPQPHQHARPGGHRGPQRHAHLRGDPGVDAGGAGPDDVRRHRRRPGARA